MKRLAVLLLLAFAMLSLPFGSAVREARSQNSSQATTAGECSDFSYYGATGPIHWATLFPKSCAAKLQSPVDIINSTPTNTPAIELDYKSTKLTVIRHHHAVQVNYDPGSSISYGGATYNLEQFHFHLPGEHKIRNAGYVMEMHVVHRATNGSRAVIGVLFKAEGSDNAAYTPIVENLPPPGSEHGGTGPDINATTLLPANRSYYRYAGSLTTPCCDEGVLWFVLADPVKISSDQLRRFQISQEGKHNSRPVQRRIRADK